MIERKRLARVVFSGLLVTSILTLGAGYLTYSPDDHRLHTGDTVADPSDGMTVIATDSNAWLGNGEGPRAKSELVAIGADGTVEYYDDTHTRYWDVDPVAGTDRTVEYVANDHLSPEECGGDTPCTRIVVERVNLTTGEMTQVFERITPGKHATRWHDVDRVDEDHLAVADIDRDRVFVVNTTNDVVTWSWNAQNAFDPATSGGPYPSDWTHLNDIEVLEDGRYMASVRNHDQVVFLDPADGLQENWTLGSDNEHRVLYEQHNPDYIPESNGGPAVLVADSENNRLVEYQRTDGDWTRTWTWSDDRLQWPRDADRLPNGNTLISDSNGNRVFEVDQSGEIVWEAEVAFPYEAERLGTGAESTGGPSANQAAIENRTVDQSADEEGAFDAVASLLPSGPITNAVYYVRPIWVGALEGIALAVLVTTSVVWAGAELYWSPWRPRFRSPVELEREQD